MHHADLPPPSVSIPLDFLQPVSVFNISRQLSLFIFINTQVAINRTEVKIPDALEILIVSIDGGVQLVQRSDLLG